MAVTGDIDLTLGLDFYRHKKEYKSNPLIPWARKAKEYIKSTVSNFTISYTNNSNNITNTNLSRSNKDLSFLSPAEHQSHSLNKFKYKTTTNSPVSLSKKVLYFIDSMTSLQNAISKKDPNVSKLKIDFEREKKNLILSTKIVN